MRSVCYSLVALWMALLPTLPPDEKAAAVQALRRSREVSALEPSNVSYRLEAKASLSVPSSGLAEGRFLGLWQSERRYRWEFRSSTYSEVRLRNDRVQWIWRSWQATPIRVSQATTALDSVLRQETSHLEPRKVKDRRVEGIQMRCVELKGSDSDEQHCFHPTTGVPLLIRRKERGNREVVYRFLQHEPFGPKSVPRGIQVFEDKERVADIHIELLAELDSLPQEALQPPAGSREFPVCDKPEPPVALKTVEPRFPGFTGTVILTALVGSDGTVREAAVVQTMGEEVDAAAVAAVRQWKFLPMLCEGVPGPAEVNIQINFKWQ
jgi:TonB family protein